MVKSQPKISQKQSRGPSLTYEYVEDQIQSEYMFESPIYYSLMALKGRETFLTFIISILKRNNYTSIMEQ